MSTATVSQPRRGRRLPRGAKPSAEAAQQRFSVPHARRLIADLFELHAVTYWADFLVHLTIGYVAAGIYLTSPLFTWYQIVCYFIAGFALFRVGSFIHEIVHMSGRQMRAFRVAFDILAGIPLLMPSFFYRNHIDHHSQKYYGTGLDGEYLPLGTGPFSEISKFVLQAVFIPLVVFARFLFTPVSFLHPRLRKWTMERASFFMLNLKYRQPIPSKAPVKWWTALEVCCSMRAWLIPTLILVGAAPWSRLGTLYALAVLTLGLNYIRNLVAHRYEHTGHPMDHVEQLTDSVNIEGVPIITELFFPLALRYHALHHLFPTLPYHNLRRAHRRLLSELPEGSLYHQTVAPGFWSATGQLIQNVRRAHRRRRAHRPLGADFWYGRRKRTIARERPEVG